MADQDRTSQDEQESGSTVDIGAEGADALRDLYRGQGRGRGRRR